MKGKALAEEKFKSASPGRRKAKATAKSTAKRLKATPAAEKIANRREEPGPNAKSLPHLGGTAILSYTEAVAGSSATGTNVLHASKPIL